MGRHADLYRGGSYAPKGYRSWLAESALPVLRACGLDRPPMLDPATGVRAIGAPRDATRGLIAAELRPAVAANIQPTPF